MDDLRKMEQRLEKGDQLCRTATGEDLARLNAFWLGLLKEYEQAWKRQNGQ